MGELQQRFLTALLLIALTVAALFWLPTIGFQLLTLAATIVAIFELTTLTQQTRPWRELLITVFVIIGGLVTWLAYAPSIPTRLLSLIAMAFWLLMLVVMLTRQAAAVIVPGKLSASIGLAIIGVAWLTLITIREEQGAFRLLSLLGLTWVADSGAYFAGKKFGKHKLAPNISPGKSIEGLMGGVLAVVVYVLILQAFDRPLIDWWLAIILALMSVVGDLTESQLKRNANLKDSGHFLPGHGGLLDRTDSMIAVLPCYYALHILFTG